MNNDRRTIGRVCVELIKECSEIGEMSERAHVALTDALSVMKSQEYWQLKNQERHEGKNAATDKQIGICKVALPALEAAARALDEEDYQHVIDQLTLAITTEGEVVKKSSRKDLRSKSK